jgi:hypothetical protein
MTLKDTLAEPKSLGNEKVRAHNSSMEDDDPWAARAGWNLTSERIAKNPDGLDLPALLDRLESEMGNSASEVQWTGAPLRSPRSTSTKSCVGKLEDPNHLA